MSKQLTDDELERRFFKASDQLGFTADVIDEAISEAEELAKIANPFGIPSSLIDELQERVATLSRAIGSIKSV